MKYCQLRSSNINKLRFELRSPRLNAVFLPLWTICNVLDTLVYLPYVPTKSNGTRLGTFNAAELSFMGII